MRSARVGYRLEPGVDLPVADFRAHLRQNRRLRRILEPFHLGRIQLDHLDAEFRQFLLRLVDIRLVEPDRGTLERHYAEHEGKPFYEPLLEFMMSGPSVAIRLAGNRVIEGFRSLAGTTDPTTAAPGTIRGDLGRDWGLKVQQNLVHGSDSPESAARELAIWFA